MPETTPTHISAAAGPLTSARVVLTSVLELLADETPDGYRLGSYDRQDAKHEALSQLPAVRAAVDAAIVKLVAELRGTALYGSWDEIGAALGISKQAARERFKRAGIQ